MSPRATTLAFYGAKSGTITYIVTDDANRRAAIIDPVLDYDLESSRITTTSSDQVLNCLAEHDLRVDWILETHVHADHLSGAHYLRCKTGARIAIGTQVCAVQATFKKAYDLDRQFIPDGSQFDRLFEDGDEFNIGEVAAMALHVPGHTPADMAYQIDDAVYVGDTLLMPDVGSARADFPGGNARQLFRSIRRLLEFPSDATMYVCHDYPPASRAAAWRTTVAGQRANNIHARDGVPENEFVGMRRARDATLAPPRLMLPSLQANVRAGRLPAADVNGAPILRTPHTLDVAASQL
jgi:glyoxylase-like metal-dependent hydrolase (beta-lactamase superfamily II)